jgi:Flp pilus assembly protein TadG
MPRRTDNRGIAAAELAVVAPVLLLLLLGTLDIGNYLQTSIRLERAARAGAQYAAASSADMAAIQARVIAAWPELTTADVPLPTLACECAATVVACTQACPSGLVQTITVTARRTLTTHLLPAASRGTGSAVVRLR